MISFSKDRDISTEAFIDLLNRSTLGERRPTDDLECMQGMMNNTNLCIGAWDGDNLVGIARSITDFHYACYLSDLAVDANYQKAGIGKKLIQCSKDELGPHCTLYLISAPAALEYYPKIGFKANERCFQLSPSDELIS